MHLCHVAHCETELTFSISSNTICIILQRHLGVKKVWPRWNLHIQNKTKHIYSITGDELWMYAYGPESKQPSTVWVFKDEPNLAKYSSSKRIEIYGYLMGVCVWYCPMFSYLPLVAYIIMKYIRGKILLLSVIILPNNWSYRKSSNFVYSRSSFWIFYRKTYKYLIVQYNLLKNCTQKSESSTTKPSGSWHWFSNKIVFRNKVAIFSVV